MFILAPKLIALGAWLSFQSVSNQRSHPRNIGTYCPYIISHVLHYVFILRYVSLYIMYYIGLALALLAPLGFGFF